MDITCFSSSSRHPCHCYILTMSKHNVLSQSSTWTTGVTIRVLLTKSIPRNIYYKTLRIILLIKTVYTSTPNNNTTQTVTFKKLHKKKPPQVFFFHYAKPCVKSLRTTQEAVKLFWGGKWIVISTYLWSRPTKTESSLLELLFRRLFRLYFSQLSNFFPLWFSAFYTRESEKTWN